MFFPRGGSAHVARALAYELPAHGWDVTLVSGSQPGHGDAHAFYAGLDVHVVDFAAGDAPMHPSYEDRLGAPDPVFAAVGDADYEEHVRVWGTALVRAGAAGHDVLHLHHLTPLHEAAARVAPGVPVVTHLHGTELLMLEEIAAGAPWPFAAAWVRRMRRWAQASVRVVVLAQAQIARAVELLGIDPARCVVSPNGVDPAVFRPRAVDRAEHWHHHLVREPRGWRPGAGEGSVRYTDAEIAPLASGPTLVCVSRFTAVKRLPLLVAAWARAQRTGALPEVASLVLVGGHPGEWEGRHPVDAVAQAGARNVFLAGWHDHDALPAFLSASDALVLASVREQFGSVLVEAMACELPVIAVDRHGPAEIVEPGVTGWLVEPDDEAGLAAALAACAGDAGQRHARGRRARRAAVERYSWPALAGALAEAFAEAADVADGRLAGTA
jgi:glycosyltransferase involved in cell wall biosynthesis